MKHTFAAIALTWFGATSALNAGAFPSPSLEGAGYSGEDPNSRVFQNPFPEVAGYGGEDPDAGASQLSAAGGVGGRGETPVPGSAANGGGDPDDGAPHGPDPGDASAPEIKGAVPGEEGEQSMFHEWYDLEEWVSTDPTFTPAQEARLLQGTDPSQNLCIRNKAVPELMVIGPPKTGTTSLCAALRYTPSAQYPQSVQKWLGNDEYPARWKEGHFFDERVKNPLAMYDYGPCDNSVRRITIEGAARYSNDPTVPRAIHMAYGAASRQIKFVYLIRDPLPRLLSQINHGKEHNWCLSYKFLTFEQICQKIVRGYAADWFGARSGCGDTVEGSMYANHIRRYFSRFESSQFRFIPFKFVTEPGEGGRPAKPVAQELWELLGAKGLPPPSIHTNKRSRNPAEALLTEGTLDAINAWFDRMTGPMVLAELLANSEAKLWGLEGERSLGNVAQWIQTNW